MESKTHFKGKQKNMHLTFFEITLFREEAKTKRIKNIFQTQSPKKTKIKQTFELHKALFQQWQMACLRSFAEKTRNGFALFKGINSMFGQSKQSRVLTVQQKPKTDQNWKKRTKI